MKKIFLVLAVLVSLRAFAGNPDKNFILKKSTSSVLDNNDKKLSIGLAVGLAAPLQEYGSTTSTTDTTRTVGYAKAGFHYNITLAYKFSKYVGAMFMLGGNINGVNTNAISSNLSSGGVSIPATIKASGGHYVGQYLVGPYLSVPLTSKFFIEVRALIGFTHANYPKISQNITYAYPGVFTLNSSADTKINGGVGLGYNFGAGAKYLLGEHIAATFFIDYAGGSITYKGSTSSYTYSQTSTQTGTQSSSGTTNSTTHLKMSLGLLNVSGGLAYSF